MSRVHPILSWMHIYVYRSHLNVNKVHPDVSRVDLNVSRFDPNLTLFLPICTWCIPVQCGQNGLVKCMRGVSSNVNTTWAKCIPMWTECINVSGVSNIVNKMPFNVNSGCNSSVYIDIAGDGLHPQTHSPFLAASHLHCPSWVKPGQATKPQHPCIKELFHARKCT